MLIGWAVLCRWFDEVGNICFAFSLSLSLVRVSWFLQDSSKLGDCIVELYKLELGSQERVANLFSLRYHKKPQVTLYLLSRIGTVNQTYSGRSPWEVFVFDYAHIHHP